MNNNETVPEALIYQIGRANHEPCPFVRLSSGTWRRRINQRLCYLANTTVRERSSSLSISFGIHFTMTLKFGLCVKLCNRSCPIRPSILNMEIGIRNTSRFELISTCRHWLGMYITSTSTRPKCIFYPIELSRCQTHRPFCGSTEDDADDVHVLFQQDLKCLHFSHSNTTNSPSTRWE